MLLSKAKEILDAQVFTCEDKLDMEIEKGFAADLMSDVLAFSMDKGILLTGLVNLQVVRTAEMMDIKSICFVRGKAPTPEIVEFAKQKSIVIFSTKLLMFNACGLLYANGLGGAFL